MAASRSVLRGSGESEMRSSCFPWSALVLIVLSVSPALGQSFTDPASYCRVVGTIDKPDARYQGPKLPPWMAAKLHLTSDQGDRMEWRCARGAVLACLYGANIPCDA